MISSFIHEIDKQIASTTELYNKTKLEIFKKMIQKLEDQKSKILLILKSSDYVSH